MARQCTDIDEILRSINQRLRKLEKSDSEKTEEIGRLNRVICQKDKERTTDAPKKRGAPYPPASGSWLAKCGSLHTLTTAIRMTIGDGSVSEVRNDAKSCYNDITNNNFYGKISTFLTQKG